MQVSADSGSGKQLSFKKAIVLTLVLVATVVAVGYVQSGSEAATGVDRSSRFASVTKYSCPPGTYEKPGSRTKTGCVCLLCNTGRKCAGGVNAVEVKCGLGLYQNEKGQKACKQASKGYYVDRRGSAQQFGCKAGSYADQKGLAQCKLASKGHFVPNGKAIDQRQCLPGTYQPSRGSKTCLKCDVGHQCPGTKRTDQLPCSVGTYQASRGQAGCVRASKGSFVPADKASYETKCRPGSYQDRHGQGSCKPASPGNYVAGSGATGQARCKVNTYQPCGGQHVCIPCPAEKGSGDGATACPFTRVCALPSGTAATSFAQFRSPKAGNLKRIKMMYLSGKFKYCGPNSKAECQGYFGIALKTHGFDVYFTRRDYKKVLFPIVQNTKGMTPLNGGGKVYPLFPFYKLAGQDPASKKSVILENSDPTKSKVSAGEELRLYMGEVLYQYFPADNLGKVCYNLELTYA